MPPPPHSQTLGELLSQAQRQLLSQGQRPLLDQRQEPPHAGRGARLDAELLLAHLLSLNRGQLLARTEQPDPGVAAHYFELVARRAAGAPVAYLVGTHEFWSLTLRVTPDVLVPRPETELVVERALALAAEPVARVADLGCGSGAIALALATERPQWQILATDVSAAALDVARGNALALQLTNVAFAQGSWFGALAGEHLRDHWGDHWGDHGGDHWHERLDLIVSNPPYLAAGDAALADPVLQHEPRGALVSGPDGLEAYRAIIGAAPEHLKPGAWLILEHGATQAAGLAALLVEGGFTHVRCHPDLAGLERVTEARRP